MFFFCRSSSPLNAQAAQVAVEAEAAADPTTTEEATTKKGGKARGKAAKKAATPKKKKVGLMSLPPSGCALCLYIYASYIKTCSDFLYLPGGRRHNVTAAVRQAYFIPRAGGLLPSQ